MPLDADPLNYNQPAACPWARLAAVQASLLAHGGLLARQGAVVATWRHVAGRRYGPYFRLAFRDRRQQRSIYLGRDPALAKAVDQLLAQHQHPHRYRLLLARLRREARDALRAQLPALRRQLALYGMHLRGLGHVVRIRACRAQRDTPPSVDDLETAGGLSHAEACLAHGSARLTARIRVTRSIPRPHPRCYDDLLTKTWLAPVLARVCSRLRARSPPWEWRANPGTMPGALQ